MPKNNDLKELLNKSMAINVILGVAVVMLVLLLYYQSSVHPTTTTNVIIKSGNTTTISNAISNQSGGTLAGIDQPLNASQLAVINSAPLSYYETAGQRLLNGSLSDEVLASNSYYLQYNSLIINGKPSVVYLGAITCVFCGENRWAMALALAKFGNFSALYTGYSALGDQDVPTLYWIPVNYTVNGGIAFGNMYQSNLINFYSAEYETPITGGFVPPTSVKQFVTTAPNANYKAAYQLLNSTGKYQGTPFTFWGTSLVQGADAVVFGNTTPQTTPLPLTEMTHAQVINQLSSFNDQFAWGEYAGADVYIAAVCPTINFNAPVCKLPAIQQIANVIGA